MNQSKIKVVTSFASLSLVAALVAACGASDAAGGGDVTADQLEIVRGVPDKGRNPAVVAIDIGGVGMCSGALVAPDVVLTARHCVSKTAEAVQCPSNGAQVLGTHAPSSLKILVGDVVSRSSPVAEGREIVAPQGDVLCDEDVALIVLDRPVPGVEPLAVHAEGVAKGAHVSAIGYGRAGDGASAGEKLLREHVKVLDTSAAEFLVGEATCQGDSGGPALDEDSGEIVGVVSRGGPTCDGKGVHNVYTRTDVFLRLIDQAIAKSVVIPPYDGDDADAGARHRGADHGRARGDGGVSRAKPKGHKPKSDVGAACKAGGDCATGVCVTGHAAEYCSRTCDAHDRCPAHFRCAAVSGGASVCVQH